MVNKTKDVNPSTVLLNPSIPLILAVRMFVLKTLQVRQGLPHCLRSRSRRISLMMASKGRMLWGLARAKVEFSLVFFYCTLFFLAGFYGSLLFSPGLSGGRMPRGRLLEVEKEALDLPGMPYGETGESLPPQPHQMAVVAIRLVHLHMSCADAIERGDSDLVGTSTEEMRIVLTRGCPPLRRARVLGLHPVRLIPARRQALLDFN